MYYIYFIELPVFFKKLDAVCGDDVENEPNMKDREICKRKIEIGTINGYHETVSKKYTLIDTLGGRWCVNMKYDVFKQFLDKHIEAYHKMGNGFTVPVYESKDIKPLNEHLTYNDIPDEYREADGRYCACERPKPNKITTGDMLNGASRCICADCGKEILYKNLE